MTLVDSLEQEPVRSVEAAMSSASKEGLRREGFDLGDESAVVPSTQPVCSLMESDDEPLVRSTEGRNVVPRISSLQATEASERVPSTVPAESIPTWVDRDADECSVSSESCWVEQEDLIGEEIPEWGVLPCLAPVVPPLEDCNTRAAVHHRLPSRRLVLVGGGSQSQNRYNPLAHEDVRATPQLRVMQGEDIPTPRVSGVDPHGIGESDTDTVDGQSDRDPMQLRTLRSHPKKTLQFRSHWDA